MTNSSRLFKKTATRRARAAALQVASLAEKQLFLGPKVMDSLRILIRLATPINPARYDILRRLAQDRDETTQALSLLAA